MAFAIDYKQFWVKHNINYKYLIQHFRLMENVKKLRKKASKSPLDKTVQDASELGSQQQRSRSREGEAQTSSVHKDGNGVITLSFSKEEVKQDSGQSTSGHGGVKKNGKKVGGANTKLPKIN